MEKKYQRGDAYRNEREVMPPEQIIANGEAYEELIKNKGWILLNNWVEKFIDLNRKRLESIRETKTIEEVNDIRIVIDVYKWIMARPKECIDKKNKLLEDIKKRSVK